MMFHASFIKAILETDQKNLVTWTLFGILFFVKGSVGLSHMPYSSKWLRKEQEIE